MGFSYGNRPGARIPAMEQRHFWFIADTIQSQVDDVVTDAKTVSDHYADGLLTLTEATAKHRAHHAQLQALYSLTLEFVRGCKASNSKFNSDKFWEACGFISTANGYAAKWSFVEVAA